MLQIIAWLLLIARVEGSLQEYSWSGWFLLHLFEVEVGVLFWESKNLVHDSWVCDLFIKSSDNTPVKDLD